MSPNTGKSFFKGLKFKLLLLVLIPILLFAVLSTVSIMTLNKLAADANLIARDRLPKTQSILMVRVHANALMRFLWTGVAVKDSQMRNAKLDEASARYEKLEGEINHFLKYKMSEKMHQFFSKIEKDSHEIDEPLKVAIALIKKNELESDQVASKQIMKDIVPKIYEISASVDEATKLLDSQVEEEIVDAEKSTRFGQNLVLGVSTIGAIFLVLYGLFTANKLFKTLAEINTSINDAQNLLSKASDDLSSASHEASAGASQAAGALEETVASIEEITSMVQNNAKNSQSASELSADSIRSAMEGESEMKRLIESMHGITDSSKKIEQIINVIDDIAFQTNLLALNAAVEAARAGEQGKGFAVVADAVRTLAQRSAVAAKDIDHLIKDSVDKVAVGAKIADKGGSYLQSILESVKKVSALNGEIATASSEQADGISQITKAMNELDASVQQNAQASENVAHSSEKLEMQAKILHVSVLKLENVLHGTRVQLDQEVPGAEAIEWKLKTA